MEDPTETTPLLPSSARPRAHAVVLLITAVIFVATLGASMLAIPTLQTLEDILCAQHYGTMESPENNARCKIDEIQSELAYVTGIQSMLEAIPSILFAFPYGMLADKIGRRPVLASSLIGMAFAVGWMLLVLRLPGVFPVRFIWTSTLWQIFGGGSSVMVSMAYSIIADVESDEGRTNAFFFVLIASLGADMIATPVSAETMKVSPWLPLCLGLGLIVVSSAMVALLPETLPTKATEEVSEDDVATNGSILLRAKAHLRHSVNELRDSGQILTPSITLLLATFMIHALVGRSLSFGLQYFSKRFAWTISDVGFLFSVRSFVQIILLLVILPGISKVLISPRFPFRLHPVTKDLRLAQVSGCILTIGALFMAGPTIGTATAGLIIFTLGSGFSALCRSTATTMVDEQHVARLYALISVVDACSSLCAGPFLAWLFHISMRLHGLLLGLPYLGMGVLCALATLAVVFVRPSIKDGLGIGDSESEHED